MTPLRRWYLVWSYWNSHMELAPLTSFLLFISEIIQLNNWSNELNICGYLYYWIYRSYRDVLQEFLAFEKDIQKNPFITRYNISRSWYSEVAEILQVILVIEIRHKEKIHSNIDLVGENICLSHPRKYFGLRSYTFDLLIK